VQAGKRRYRLCTGRAFPALLPQVNSLAPCKFGVSWIVVTRDLFTIIYPFGFCRTSFYCVSVPGESDWSIRQQTSVRTPFHDHAEISFEPSLEGSGRKRRLASALATSGKRFQREDGSSAPTDASLSGVSESKSSYEDIPARPGNKSCLAPLASVPSEVELGLPLGVEQNSVPPCLVRMYGDLHGLRLCDVVEFVGIYSPIRESTSPSLEPPSEADAENFLATMFAAQHPPASIVPRLQCVFFRQLCPTYPTLQPGLSHEEHVALKQRRGEVAAAPVSLKPFAYRTAFTPAVDSSTLSPTDGETVVQELIRSGGEQATIRHATEILQHVPVRAVRDEMHAYLTDLFGGDPIAAEYVLFVLLSRVTKRSPQLLGRLSVAIDGMPDSAVDVPVSPPATESTHPPHGDSSPLRPTINLSVREPVHQRASAVGKDVRDNIAAMTGRTALIPLRVDVLNTARFAPASNPDAERLLPGILGTGCWYCLDCGFNSNGNGHAVGARDHELAGFTAGDCAAGINFPVRI
jgi:hypothetical protein